MISEPERLAASTTTTPSDSPETSRLRRGKSRARGSQPSGISVMSMPPLVDDLSGERDILLGIDAVEAAGEHGDGAGGETGPVRGGVDAAGEAGDDGVAAGAEVGGQHGGHLLAGGRGVARADDGDGTRRRSRFSPPVTATSGGAPEM